MSKPKTQVTHHWSHRIPLLGPIAMVRPRWSLSVLLGVAVYFALSRFSAPIRLIGAWDAASLFFLVTTIVLALKESAEDVRRRAQLMDEGAVIVLLLTLTGVAASLLTIVTTPEQLKSFAGGKEIAAVIVGTTVVLSWMVTQTSFALHYANLYYSNRSSSAAKDSNALDFPGDKPPDYLDFAYFSFVLGMTFQVSDVPINDRRLRHLALLHSMISFFFSTVIVALTINLLAGFAQQ